MSKSIFPVSLSYHPTVLVPALRGHGLSEGRYAGMGWLDRRDLMRWISLIIDSDADARILLQGKSMGAAAVMGSAVILKS